MDAITYRPNNSEGDVMTDSDDSRGSISWGWFVVCAVVLYLMCIL